MKPKNEKTEKVQKRRRNFENTTAWTDFFWGRGGGKIAIMGGGIIAINRKKFISPRPPPR